MAESTRLSISQRSMDQVPLSERLMKRPVRSRMRGVVGRAGLRPALTRLHFINFLALVIMT